MRRTYAGCAPDRRVRAELAVEGNLLGKCRVVVSNRGAKLLERASSEFLEARIDREQRRAEQGQCTAPERSRRVVLEERLPIGGDRVALRDVARRQQVQVIVLRADVAAI